MLIGQVVLYISTALPFVSMMAYTTVTQYDPASSKSAYRIAAENFALTATGSFGTYLFNGVSQCMIVFISGCFVILLVIFLCLHIDCTHISS